MTLQLSGATVDWAHTDRPAGTGHSFPEQSLWTEGQDLVGRQRPHADHMVAAGVKSSPRQGGCCFQKDGELSKVYNT